MWQVFITVFFAGCVQGLPDFHEGLPPEDLSRYFGVQNGQNIPDYEIVSPKQKHGNRTRRSSQLRYDLTAFGEQFQLQLEHNDDLIAPGCLVQTIKPDGSKTVRPCPRGEEDCYYQGVSLNHNGSQASLSTCDGLRGLIRLPDRGHDVWVVPVDERHASRAKRRADVTDPHIVYRRPPVADRKNTSTGLSEVRDLLNQAETVGRRRRQAGDKFAEMLLVADSSMHGHHGDRLTHYLLTVANVASRILTDSSIGTPLQLAVVKINILEGYQAGLVITENVEQTLDSFCDWQERYNPPNDHNPQHYDAAALFTRINLAKGGMDGTRGFARLSGMCRARDRCSLNQDDGLGVGLTLAHETGHLLGAVHDGTGTARSCADGRHVMSSQGGAEGTAMLWSPCSRDTIQHFLGTPQSSCLSDRPQTMLNDVPGDLPGMLYDGNAQCELFLGQGSTLCESSSANPCSRLMCSDPRAINSCKIDSVPLMDGTVCGQRKYCLRGQCVNLGYNGPRPRDGGWSAWDSQWSACSRSCGGGVRFKTRRCDNPRPWLGRDCTGSAVTAEMCNVQPCSTSQQDYRAEQCAMTNSDPVQGHRYNWVPYDGDNSCTLRCNSAQGHLGVPRLLDNRNWFRDGTVCEPSASASFGRCVQGECVAFGCDHKSGSRYQYDKCGVCGGRGNTCYRQTGRRTEAEPFQYITFLTIPSGATSIHVTNTNLFSQMSVQVRGRRIFNEVGGTTDPSGSYSGFGVEVQYERTHSQETIEIPGPLPVSVQLQVRRNVGDQYMNADPDIVYEYYVPSSTRGKRAVTYYVWRAQDGACSKSCGGGVYERVLTCTNRSDGAQVDDHFCDILQKPDQAGSACNNHPCPPRWRIGEYGKCSNNCTQTRAVDCVQGREGMEEVISPDRCSASQRPPESRDCNQTNCKPSASCADVDPNCAAYHPSVCKQRAMWASIQCRKYCGFC